jgi:hypothetical protein
MIKTTPESGRRTDEVKSRVNLLGSVAIIAVE